MKNITNIIGPVKVNNEKSWTVQIWYKELDSKVSKPFCTTLTFSSKKLALSAIEEEKNND